MANCNCRTAARNLFSACGQAGGPAGGHFWATATFFTLSDGWSVEEEGGLGPIRGHRSRSASTICLHASATAFEVDVLEAAVLGQSCKIFAFSRADGWEYPARPI